MANFDSVDGGTLNIGQLLGDVTINTFDRLVRGFVLELLSTHVNDFNLMNYDFMNFHMFRNAYEKEVTLRTLGENAYRDGNSDSDATPAQYPTYTKGNNYYMEFVPNTREAEKNGVLTTRVQKAEDENSNKYLDMDSGDSQVEFTGRAIDRNSILYKTKKLMRQKKIKTIISAFHTDKVVEYNGQIGTKKFGESHGRNLLTKEVALGGTSPKVNNTEYDNPYCRVWTHHYKYDTLKKTIRAESDNLAPWTNFEWDETDKGHTKDRTKYGDGENYDYAWKGKHNQDRIKAHSVLDKKTGLVKITPQYGDKEETNRHTKDCMFSIENLAWKDYDPYAFEQALSWEQRGPLGGRIMWFPPYGIEVTETASAKWQTNDFIGRGEPVYTYVNSERSGNLSFLMITDHPSTIDYASWWDDNNMVENKTDSKGNCENDYLRYFAGCNNDNTDGKTGGLIVKPTPMTDEYLQGKSAPLIKKELLPEPEQEIAPAPPQPRDESPTIIEFFVFFPNNYSGYWDAPTQTNAKVNAIAYLLAGRDAQKKFDRRNGSYGETDLDLHLEDTFDYTLEPGGGGNCYIGYEMGKGGITTKDCVKDKYGFFIQGGNLSSKEGDPFSPVTDKKWQYRIDHRVPYTAGNDDPLNTINQKNTNNYSSNIKDTQSYKLNLEVNDDIRKYMQNPNAEIYSFAEIATALYSSNIPSMTKPSLYAYLLNCLNNVPGAEERIDRLKKIFANEDLKLTKLEIWGAASSQGGGKNLRNQTLANNRANTILKWLHTYSKWLNVENTCQDDFIQIIQTDEAAGDNINHKSAKLGRCAHCVMTFESGKVQPTTAPVVTETTVEEPQQPVEVNRNIVGFTYIDSIPQPDGTYWDYYRKDGTIKYYDQKGDSQDNYETPEKDVDVVVTEQDVVDIFNDVKPNQSNVVTQNSLYRGEYNEYGMYISTYDYSKGDNPNIHTFVDGGPNNFNESDYLYYNESFYKVINGDITQSDWADVPKGNLDDVTRLMFYYNTGDIVLYNDKYYTCKVGPDGTDFPTKYSRYEYSDFDWEEITEDNISQFIKSEYRFVGDISIEKYEVKDIWLTVDDEFILCTKSNVIKPNESPDYWTTLNYTTFVPVPGRFTYKIGDFVLYNNALYVCVDNTYYTDNFNDFNWDLVEYVQYSTYDDYYKKGAVVLYNDEYYTTKKDLTQYEWTSDLRPAFKNLVCDSSHPKGEFNGNHEYKVNECCFNDDKYYCCTSENLNSRSLIPFNTDYFELEDAKYIYSYDFDWEITAVVKKSAAVLCWTIDKMFDTIVKTQQTDYTTDGDSDCYNYQEKSNYDCIWKYGETNDLVTPQTVQRGTNLYNYARGLEEGSRPDSGLINPPIKFSVDENRYIEIIVDNEYHNLTPQQKSDKMIEIRIYIILCRVLDGISKIEDSTGTRKVCDNPSATTDEMNAMTKRIDESESGCANLWVDRGDGLLIQDCNIQREHNPYNLLSAREDQRRGYNKLRYDQEYHFYKHFSVEHPLLFQRLQEKIKYFNPAFHSMTPEGFNARCTFLQQCTRQGNTKTMSDISGKTANNLAFGRPPYCVLRLGDFYNQMIVIENITFDYNVSEGLQWDLNPEGNGVQPMLCKVNISFKFIGGGDITGPVQRLQNAMSFNYYANTSFYDNRADRIEYQPTNWKTMGGAGNNEIDVEKSYAYLAQNYEENPELNIVTYNKDYIKN